MLLTTLVGCQSMDSKDKESKTEYVPIPDTLLLDCDFPPPPDRQKYKKMSSVEKEKTMVNIYLEASKMNEACNIRLNNARIFQENMKQLYRSKNTPVEKIK